MLPKQATDVISQSKIHWSQQGLNIVITKCRLSEHRFLINIQFIFNVWWRNLLHILGFIWFLRDQLFTTSLRSYFASSFLAHYNLRCSCLCSKKKKKKTNNIDMKYGQKYKNKHNLQLSLRNKGDSTFLFTNSLLISFY